MRLIYAGILICASIAGAAEPPSYVVAPPPPPPKKFVVYSSLAFNAYTYLAPTPTSKAVHLTPANRAILGEQVGVGYFVHPMVRLTLTLQLAEYLSGTPSGASSFALLGFIPWVMFTTHGFFTGAGPMVAPISYGKIPNFDIGLYTATGYNIVLGRGVSLAPALQFVVMFGQRTAVQLTPALALAYRF
jgi:hypothetical protein